jgi:hypothetical protein
MVIGGVANSVWGVGRSTYDVDLSIGAHSAMVPRILKALGKQIGKRPQDAEQFAHDTGILPFDHRSGVRVDLAFSTGPYALHAIERAVEINIQDVLVRFCTPEDLLLHKIISDRERDRTHVIGIVKLRKASLDRQYLEPRGRELAFLLEKPEIETRYRELMG